MNTPDRRYHDLPEDTRFCPYCGQLLPGARSTSVIDKIIDYRQLIARSTEGFVGRQWVRDKVDSFLRAGGKSMWLLLGEPGCGKTSFMAQLVKERKYPHHFIGKGSQTGLASALDWRDPVRFAESIGYQLVRDYGGWIIDWERWGIKVSQRVRDLQGLLVGASVGSYEALPRPADQPAISVREEIERFGPAAGAIGVYIENFKVDVERVVGQLLTDPLKAIARRWPEHQVVIVVDGLDEAFGYSAERNIFKVLPNGDLPGNVRLLLSSQPGRHLTHDFLDRVWPCWLSQPEKGRPHPGVLEDAKARVRQLVKDPQVCLMLDQHRLDPDAFIERVAWASQGNFLYLHHYAEGLQEGDETLLKLDALPEGLYGIYADLLSKIAATRDDVGWNSAYKPVLGTLAVAQAPLAGDQIAAFSGVDPETVGTILTQLRRFLDVAGERRYARHAIYHSSFGKYLVSPDNQDTIDGPAAHRRIADFYLARYAGDWTACKDPYGLDNVVHHVVGASLGRQQLVEALGKVLTVPFMEVRADQVGWHMPFVQDLHKVAEKAPERVIDPALRILLGTHRNSLTNQETLRLLRRLYPGLKAEDEWPTYRRRSHNQTILDGVAAFRHPPGDAVAELKDLLAGASDEQVQGVLLLALGETGSQDAFETLHDNLLHGSRHVGWCAADGLLALNTPKLRDPQLVNTLRQDFRQTCQHPIKQRILYVLGRLYVRSQLPAWLSFDEALSLTQEGLKLRGNSKGRAIDLIWQLLPKAEEDRQRWVDAFEPWLWQKLGLDRKGLNYLEPEWSNEWIQKRIVTALGRVGSPAARAHLEQLREKVKARPRRKSKVLRRQQELDRQRTELEKSIERAIDDLHRRHL